MNDGETILRPRACAAKDCKGFGLIVREGKHYFVECTENILHSTIKCKTIRQAVELWNKEK